MNIDCKQLLLVYVLAVVGVLSIIAIEEVFALEQEEELEVADKVELTKSKTVYTEPSLVVTEKLKHKIGVSGNFEGMFDNKMINTTGKYYLGGQIETFVLVGTFESAVVEHWNPYTGLYVTSNPNCQNIVGDLILESKETKINLEYNGKNCKYGLISYVVGTFEVTDSSGKYDVDSGDGRITFVADHHTNNVSGQLKGSFR